ncbi:MAG: 3-ketoacyl-ACP reductase [Pseudomonadota bacterium]|nr:3-ketoacyl-ACP reductase [Pseudomonadota bacterium]
MPDQRQMAVVTGAARGIGAAIAQALAAKGYDLALIDRPGSDAREVLAQVRAHGGRGALFPADLADVDAHVKLVEGIVAWGGPVCCLVNNAGIGSPRRGDLLEIPVAAFDAVLDVNLRGTFFLTQVVARQMVAGDPRLRRAIVTVSSVSAELASIERGEYCMSKAGLAMLTRLFALRLAPHGIPVFEVRPGVIRTPMTEGVAEAYDQRIRDGLVPMCRWGSPADVADTVAMLASSNVAFATGSVIQVDGALSIPRL